MPTHLTIGLLVMTAACGGQSATTTTDPALATVSSTGGGGDRHQIVLHRPHRVGDRAELTLRAQSVTTQRITIEGQEVQNDVDSLDIVLVADGVIQEVDERGKATKTEYTVRQCTTGGDQPRELLPAGSVIVVTAVPPPGDGTITLRGGELTEEQIKRIDLVVSTTVSPVDDDELFGSEEPRAIGDTWAVDSNLAARDLSKIENLTFAADNVEGGTTFTALETVDDVPCQRLEATMRAQGFELTGLPEGATPQDASLELQMSGALPLDTSIPRLRSDEAMRMQMTFHVPTEDGRTAVMTVDNQRVTTREVRPR